MKKLLIVLLMLLPLATQAEQIDCNDRANEVRMSDRLDEAIDVLGDCLSEELNRVARTYLLLGLTYYDAKEQNKAIANYSKAIEFAPNYVTAFANRGLSYSMKGNYKDALEDFDKAIDLDPGYMQAYYFRAFAHQREGNHQRAIEDFTTALTMTSDTSEMASIYYSRGRANKELKRYDDAYSDYGEAISLKPDDADFYYSRALLHHQRKDHDAAIADYSRTIELNDQHARAYYNRGLCIEKQARTSWRFAILKRRLTSNLLLHEHMQTADTPT